MALPGYYKINFTDPRKEGFIIEPYLTNGAISPISPILDPNASQADTSLLLYGRDVPNYGERIAENFVQLLENFAGAAEPLNPIEGQLWFDTGIIYVVASQVASGTLSFLGDVAADFTAFAKAGTRLTIAFRPLNEKLDNSYQKVDVIAKIATVVDANTQVIFVAANGDGVSLPSAVVGGFVALAVPTSSRMRIATTVSGKIKWVDISNVYSSADAPTKSLTIGDLWYDSSSQQLRVYGQSGWGSVAGRYLPLTGGVLEGTLDMGLNKVFSGGVITAGSGDLYALTNREYVDGVEETLAAAIAEVAAELKAVTDSTEKSLDLKVNRAGDRMTGTLLFGDDTTTTLPRGIDAGNNPIINVQLTWNATDYLTAFEQSNHVVDKAYVAKAITQHLIDAPHGSKGFIDIQEDGTGIFPNTVSFSAGTAGKSHSLAWYDSSGNNFHQIYAQFAGAASQLVIQAGTDSADTVDIRHASDSGTNPLFRVSLGSTMSYQTTYLLDGQPQPVYGGAATAINDDTAAAAKGFVRQYVADNAPATVIPGTTLTGGMYAYNVTNKQYSLSLTQSAGGDTVTVDMYHKHDVYDIDYTYKQLAGLPWAEVDPLVSEIPLRFPAYPNFSVGTMLEVLNTFKAPVKDAVFTTVPRSGIDASIVEYNTAAKTIRVVGSYVAATKIGGRVGITGSTGNDGAYTVTAVAQGAVLNGSNTTVFTVGEAIAVNGIENAEDATLTHGLYSAATAQDDLVTRTTLDFEIAAATSRSYMYVKVAAGTSTAIPLTFNYNPNTNSLFVFRNGQKLRANTMIGGDYNETSQNTITVAATYAGDEFEIYKI